MCGVGSCAIEGLYSLICRDVETASGGIDPTEVVLHASGFYRLRGMAIETLPGDGLDRRAQIIYDGTTRWLHGNSASSIKVRTLNAVVRIGYFAGDHVDSTMGIMADDEQAIAKVIAKASNFPDCDCGGCINGFSPTSSKVVKLDETRYILELNVEVQVTA